MAEQEKKEQQEQEIPHTEEPVKAEEPAPVPEEKLVPESELLKAQAQAEEFKRKWYLTTAEYENYRKRTASSKQTAYLDGKSDVILKVLPIGDTVELALGMVSDEKTKQGMELILKNFRKVLEDEKIETIDPLGQPFDASDSEAIAAMPCAEGEEPGTVKQVYRKGYKRGDKVIRYAQVVVTQ